MMRTRLAIAVVLGFAALPVAAQVHTRTDYIAYEDNLAKWVIGQQKSVTNGETDLVESRVVYDTVTALPKEVYAFEKLQQKLTHYADGNVWTASDGNDGASINTTVTLASWKRGIPQSITFGDGNVMKARVDDYGLIRHVINEANAKTCYDFDPMGRLAKITYTSEANPPAPPADPVCDTSTYNPTTSVFEQIPGAEYGVAGGHWRRTVATGNGRTVSLYDAMWRPVFEELYDTADVNATLSRMVWRYNADGQQTFAAHPFRAMTDVASVMKGTRTTYDALGRPVRVEQDSEFATPIATTTKYLDGFLTETTDPRGKVTTTSFFNHDEPHANWPLVIAAPEDQKTTIGRNHFGHPTSLRRGNWAGTVGSTRTYGYDAAMRLCKSIDAETGTTVYDYDTMGNITMSASGLTGLPGGTSVADCTAARAAASASPRRATRAYDERGRLEMLTYADGKGSTLYTYHQDGMPRTVEATNGPDYPHPVTTTYAYNKRRLLTRETLQHNGIHWPYDYGYNANGHLAVNAWHGVTIDYAPNGRGQPTRAGTYATGVTYHPNGAMAQFTYGNGVLHTMMQNARGLPEYSKDAYGAKEFVDNRYDYDASGNVVTIADGRIDAPNARTMTYDDANRLKTATSPRFGTASYAYDVLDNIARASIGGPHARDRFYCYDAATWRLTNLKTTSCATGATVTGFGYDAQGNVSNKNGTLYDFDSGNRLRTVTYAGNPVASYAYDGHGRRVWSSTPAGEGNSQYSRDGRLVLANDLRRKTIADHIHLNGSLLASRERDATTNTYTYKYHHTDALGTPVSTTDQNRVEVARHDYEPYGKVIGSSVVDAPGYTGHVEDAATSLIYMQQRYYDPAVGRFLSVDPVTWMDNNDERHVGRYAYGYNSPYKFTDPDGRCGACDRFNDQYAGDAAAGNSAVYAPFVKPVVAAATMMLAFGQVARAVVGSVVRHEVRQRSNPQQRGRESESRVLAEMGQTKNTQVVDTSKGRTIPDFQNSRQVGEIKDAVRVSDTRQLQAQREHAQATGREHTVVTGANTNVSRNVESNSTLIRRDDLGPQSR